MEHVTAELCMLQNCHISSSKASDCSFLWSVLLHASLLGKQGPFILFICYVVTPNFNHCLMMIVPKWLWVFFLAVSLLVCVYAAVRMTGMQKKKVFPLWISIAVHKVYRLFHLIICLALHNSWFLSLFP